MIVRLSGALLLGALLTLSLIFLMQWLIAHGSEGSSDAIQGQVIEFVRVREDTEAQTKQRKLPKKETAKEPPPPPDMQLAQNLKPKLPDMTGMAVNLDFGLAGGPLGAVSDTDVMPLVRIEPQYPSRALSRGIEGWVLLEFTISAAGTVTDVVIVDADPPGIFNRAAKRAVSRWKYKPMILDGNAVPRPGIQVVLSFELDKP